MLTMKDWNMVKREFICGGTAGAIGIFVGFPFDLIKVKLQTNPSMYTSAIDCLRKTIKSDGYMGLYSGCIPPILMQGLINSLIFTGESFATRLLEPNLVPGQLASPMNSILAGIAGGLSQLVILLPSEVIKCTMQAGNISSLSNTTNKNSAWKNTIDACRTIYKSEGISGFYKGFAITALREIPGITTYFISYRFFRRTINEFEGNQHHNRSSTMSIVISGGLAGVMTWLVIYPIDVIKTNMQVTNPIITTTTIIKSNHNKKTNHPTKINIVGVINSLYKRQGIKVFYRGITTALVRAIPTNAMIFYIYEKLKPLIN